MTGWHLLERAKEKILIMNSLDIGILDWLVGVQTTGNEG